MFTFTLTSSLICGFSTLQSISNLRVWVRWEKKSVISQRDSVWHDRDGNWIFVFLCTIAREPTWKYGGQNKCVYDNGWLISQLYPDFFFALEKKIIAEFMLQHRKSFKIFSWVELFKSIQVIKQLRLATCEKSRHLTLPNLRLIQTFQP